MPPKWNSLSKVAYLSIQVKLTDLFGLKREVVDLLVRWSLIKKIILSNIFFEIYVKLIWMFYNLLLGVQSNVSNFQFSRLFVSQLIMCIR